MTEISLPYWLKAPFLLVIKFFKLGLKKIIFLTSIFIFSLFLALAIRLVIVTVFTKAIIQSV